MPLSPALPAARWQVRLLGELSLQDGQRTLTRLPSRAAAALLARLALWPERAHAREELVELLWPGVALDVGRNRLRQTLSVLKQLLEAGGGTVILTERQHLRAAPGAFACDALQFEADCRAGRFEAARALYRGELLPGFYDDWVDDERMRLAALAEALPEARLAAPVPTGPAPLPAPWTPALPLYLTPAFGMAAARERLRQALRRQRLVSIVGPGGSGKTRLAVEGARELAEAGGDWPGWLLFVPMVQCFDAAQLVDRLLITLQLDSHAAEPLEQVRQALAGRTTLLVLDNLEQVAQPAAELVTELLATLPTLRIVTTTRQVLGVDGEQLLAVEPLPLPAAGDSAEQMVANPAVALFVDRARERRSDFHLNPQNAAAIGELVRLLEGHPLAIELAAARVRSTPPTQWVQLLDSARTQVALGRASSDTLALLARAGPRGAADTRHASMLQVIAWSWRLLDDGQRSLLAALAVFDGGCDAAAARAVAEPEASPARVQQTLDELVASSLIVMHEAPGDAARPPRFTPYEAVREYAAAQFDDAQRTAWRSRHRQWLCHLPTLDGPTPDLARLRHELPNLLLALASAVHDVQAAEAWAIVWAHRAALTDLTLPATGLATLEAALQATPEPALRLLGHAVLAAHGFEAGLHVAALAHADAALALIGTPAQVAQAPELPADLVDQRPEPLPAWAVGWALRVRMRVGQPMAEDDAWLLAALQSAEAVKADSLHARLLGLQASLIMRNRNDHAGAEPLRRRVLALWTGSGNRLRANEGRIALAINLGFQRRVAEQLVLLGEVEAEARALGQSRLLCFTLSVRGYCLGDLRRHAEALQAFHACLEEAVKALAWRELFYGLWNLPRALAHLRQPERAATVMGFAQAFFAERFGVLGPEDTREARRTRWLIALQIGWPATEAAWRAGAAMSLTQVLALALSKG